MPVYNEEATLNEALKRVLALSVVGLDLIVVDDGSTDWAPAIIEEASCEDQRIRAVLLEEHRQDGSRQRRDAKGQDHVIIIQDADLEYDAVEIPKLIAPILAGEADVVYSRLQRHATLPQERRAIQFAEG